MVPISIIVFCILAVVLVPRNDAFHAVVSRSHRGAVGLLSAVPSTTATCAFRCPIPRRSLSFRTCCHHHHHSSNNNNVGFSSSSSSRRARQLQLLRLGSVIKADDLDFQFDAGQGGVRLASESAIKLTGTVGVVRKGQNKQQQVEPKIKDLIRYKSVREVSTSLVLETIQQMGGSLICTGRGQEQYKDPGITTQADVLLAPLEAVRDAVAGFSGSLAASPSPSRVVVINVLGGDDLQVLEVVEAVRQLSLVLLDTLTTTTPTTEILFHSLSHASFGSEQVTMTVVGLSDDQDENSATSPDLRGPVRAVARGEVYFRDGTYWTVIEDDINTAVA